MLGLSPDAQGKEDEMSPQGFRAVPRRPVPTVVTIDAGAPGAMSPRFLTLVVRAYREWEQPRADDSARYSIEDLPRAS
jgi:hypothetical protein